MDKKEKFREYFRVIRGRFETDPGRHLSEDELVQYYQKRLAETRRQQVQSHLVQCHDCLEVFKDVIAFFEPSEEAEKVSEATLNRMWAAYRQRVHEAPQPETPAPTLNHVGFWRSRRTAFALAAGLLIVAVTSVGALWPRRENQWQTKEKSWAERLTELEEENRRLQDQTKTLESQLAELRQPAMNAPIYDLLPQVALPRAGGKSKVYRIKAPAAARNFVLILHRSGDRRYSSYEIEIVDTSGQQHWRATGLRPNSDGSFVLTLDRTFLSQGQYRLKLYGQSGNRSQVIAEYVILIE